MGWIIGILAALAAFSYAVGHTDPASLPGPAPTTTAPNRGGGYCGIGPNDDDVHGVIRAVPNYDFTCPTR